MLRRLTVLLLTLAALAPVRPAVAACTSQKDHHCACTVQVSSATCCCTGEEIPAEAHSEAPQAGHGDPGLPPAAVLETSAVPAVAFDHPSRTGRPIAASPTPLFLLTGTFLS